MRRALVPLIIVITILVIPQSADRQLCDRESYQPPIAAAGDGLFAAAAGGSGTSTQSTQFMSRTLTSQLLAITNTYGATAKHNGTLNLTQYLLPGWTLYKMTMTIQNITASLEREVVGITPKTGTQEFLIDEVLTDVFSNELTQAFYYQSHDGSLSNYTIRYYDFGYDESTYGYAFFEIRSSYSDNTTGMTPRTNLTHKGTYGWTTFQGNNADLTKNTYYWAMIDGSNLKKVSSNYPHIYWSYEDATGTLNTGQHIGSWVMNRPYEALLNYTYTPWNRTTVSPLAYRQPQTIMLRANSTPLVSSTVWSFSKGTGNIVLVRFDSNQSVNVYHNLTLWYQRNSSANISWRISSSGALANWNSTTLVGYPSPSGQLSRYLNITKMPDWTPVGLYNGTASSNYDNFVSYSNVVYCSLMTNGTWTLKTTAFNYLTLMTTKESGSGQPLPRIVSILSDVDIESTIQDQVGSSAGSGTTNLTIWHSSSRVWAPPNASVSGGKSSYTWDISDTTNKNGAHLIEVFWTNGTEAGYLTKEMIVYYPSSLSTDSYFIDRFANSSFTVKVHYNDTFTPKGLNSTWANVEYSFNNKPNVTVTDTLHNGTWPMTVSTANMSYGTYALRVFAQGFALENRSITITVALIHGTQSLSTSWSSNNITYIEQGTLSVDYRFVNGTPVTNAIVNATIGSTTWNLHYSGGQYRITFNGTDVQPGLGTHTVTINAWKLGCLRQSSVTSFTIRKEPASVSASWMSYTIDWTQDVFLRIDYKDSDSTLITYATQRDVFVNGTLYALHGTNGTYWIEFNSTFLLGHHVVAVNVSKYGYDFAILGGITFETTTAPTALSLTWDPSNVTIIYAQSLNLTVHFTHDSVDVPSSAIVNVTVNGHTYSLSYSSGWHVSIPGKSIGLGPFDATIQASLYGYDSKTNVTTGLSITIAPNSFISINVQQSIDGYSSSILYYDGLVLFNVTIVDKDLETVTNASVNLTIEGHLFVMALQPSGNFTVTVFGNDLGAGIHVGFVHVDAYGYQEKTSNPISLPVELVPTHIRVNQGVVPSVMFLDQTSIVVFEYVNNHTLFAIDGANFTWIAWPNGLPNNDIGSGRYRVTISSQMMALTSHLLNFTLSYGNYTTAKFPAMIAVRAVQTHFTTQALYTEYENWTAELRVNYTDIDHGLPIHWADVNATIEGVIYHMTYLGSGIYSVNFRVMLSPRTNPYTVSISALAAGCMSNSTVTSLRVLAKEYVYLDLGYEGSAVEGNSIKIKATLKYNGTNMPVVGASVSFGVAAVYKNGSRLNFLESYYTSTNGESSWAFEIPVGTLSPVDHLEVAATYHGNRSTWATTNAVQIKVSLGTMALLFLFLTSTEGLMVIALVIVASVAVTVNQKKRKPKRAAMRRSLEHQLQDFKDLGTLRHFIAVYLNRGTCVFYHPFTESRIQADLISGFISAITSVYGEIKGNGVQGTLEEIHYHGLILNSYSGKYVIGMLILEGELTPLLKDRLQYFVERFEDQYRDELSDWNGQTECFDPEWIVSNLIAAFNFNWVLPHRLAPQKKISGTSKKMLQLLGTKLDEKGEFLIADVLAPFAEKIDRAEPRVLDFLLRLEENGLIVPISIPTVLQRQGMTLVDKEVCAAGTMPVSLGEVEVMPLKEETEVERKPSKAEKKAEAKPKYARAEEQVPVEEVTPKPQEPEISREVPLEQRPLKPEEQFLSEVEKLLTAEREKRGKAPESKKKKDEAESFIEDVEKLLSSDKEPDEH